MSNVPQLHAPADPSSADGLDRRTLFKAALVAVVPWGPATGTGVTRPPIPVPPLPRDDDRDRPALRFRVVHDVF
jgi:hypothetical protein